MKVSVIIPTYNEEKNIEACLLAFETQTIPRSEFEIIVVDGNSTDNTRELAKEYADIVIIQHSRFISGARNDGIQLAQYDIIATTDADCIVEPNWIETIQSTFTNSDVVMLFGPAKQLEPGLKSKLIVSTMNGIIYSLHHLKIASCTYGCNAAFDKYRFIQAGMYAIVDAGEDVEIGLRMAKQGHCKYDSSFSFKFSTRRYLQYGALKSIAIWAYVLLNKGTTKRFNYSKKDFV